MNIDSNYDGQIFSFTSDELMVHLKQANDSIIEISQWLIS